MYAMAMLRTVVETKKMGFDYAQLQGYVGVSKDTHGKSPQNGGVRGKSSMNEGFHLKINYNYRL